MCDGGDGDDDDDDLKLLLPAIVLTENKGFNPQHHRLGWAALSLAYFAYQ